jgi:hypothetical protein
MLRTFSSLKRQPLVACRGYLSFQDGYQKSGTGARFLEELKWGADWLLTSHFSKDAFVAWTSAPGDLIASHNFWGRPEDIEVSSKQHAECLHVSVMLAHVDYSFCLLIA